MSLDFINDSVSTPWMDFGWLEEGILLFKHKDSVHIDLATSKKLEQAVYEYTSGKEFTILSDLKVTGFSASKRAGKHIASSELLRAQNKGVAVLLNSFGIRILMNLFIQVNQPYYSIKYFTNGESAKYWLRISLLKAEAEQLDVPV